MVAKYSWEKVTGETRRAVENSWPTSVHSTTANVQKCQDCPGVYLVLRTVMANALIIVKGGCAENAKPTLALG